MLIDYIYHSVVLSRTENGHRFQSWGRAEPPRFPDMPVLLFNTLDTVYVYSVVLSIHVGFHESAHNFFSIVDRQSNICIWRHKMPGTPEVLKI